MKLMKDVVKELGLSADTIRYYEKIGLCEIKRDERGYRQFDQQTIDWLFLVKMLRKSGMTVESLVSYVELVKQGDESITQRKLLLIEQAKCLRHEIEQQEKVLAMLNHKIESYDQYLLRFEQERLTRGEKYANK